MTKSTATAATAIGLATGLSLLSPAKSYAELLDPVPNAQELLQQQEPVRQQADWVWNPYAGRYDWVESYQNYYHHHHHHHSHHHHYHHHHHD